jgi:PHD/YefM family antitoxin component YafN of YafNO toxin-antitoxin module
VLKETTPYPSGGFEPNQKRRSGRGTTPKKERKTKKSRRPTYEQWLEGEMPGMVDKLCRVMYETEVRNSYGSRADFCIEYADVVIDRRRVKGPVERMKLLEQLLDITEDAGRVDITHRRRQVSIFLSDAEWKMQRRQATERNAKSREKWRERRRRKAA